MNTNLTVSTSRVSRSLCLIADVASVRIAVERALMLCPDALRSRWRFGDESTADLLLVMTGSASAHRKLQHAVANGRVCAALGDADGLPEVLRLHGRVTADALMRLLFAVERRLDGEFFNDTVLPLPAKAPRLLTTPDEADVELLLTPEELAAFERWEPPMARLVPPTPSLPTPDVPCDTLPVAKPRVVAITEERLPPPPAVAPPRVVPITEERLSPLVVANPMPARAIATPMPARTDALAAQASANDAATERLGTTLPGLMLRDYLEGHLLAGAARLQWAYHPALVLDTEAGVYYCEDELMLLEPYVRSGIPLRDWQPLTKIELRLCRQRVTQQPLTRLRWLHELVHSRGELAPQFDPDAIYRLTQWFPLALDHPRHFRVARAMLRPRRLHEIAQEAGASMVEVFDIVNAYGAIDLLEITDTARSHAGR